LAKKKPDVKIAKEIQKEISSLRAELDLKRIDHKLKMKEINPEFQGFAGKFHGRGRHGKGGGRGHGGGRWN